ncbi:MAG TPA: geranylgeranyl reductase family protein [Thermoplasmata archaeon]|nr:geranylgeranyl reductase family protein [Thermoplasmata archaeon]
MERADVVVVGAGPGGSSAARFAAEGGARTLLLDQRPEIGTPVQCGEFLPSPRELADLLACPEVIAEAFQIPPGSVLRQLREMVCVAPSGHRFRFPLDGVAVGRRAFDKGLALRAESAGAELWHPCGVTEVRGDVVRCANGREIEARVIIGADGPLSTVARARGFAPTRELFRMITATAPGGFDDALELYFGHVAPGGYAWLIPKAGEANVGLGVTRVPPGETLGSLLQRFLTEYALPLAHDPTRWWVPLGPPPDSAVRGNALFVGDAANLVMATNGAGIPTAMLSGHDAGVAAAAAVRDGRPLSEYDRSWKAHLYEPLRRAWEVKKAGDRVVGHDRILTWAMHYIGTHGLDEMMRLRWPPRLFWRNL